MHGLGKSEKCWIFGLRDAVLLVLTLLILWATWILRLGILYIPKWKNSKLPDLLMNLQQAKGWVVGQLDGWLDCQTAGWSKTLAAMSRYH